MIQYNLQDSLTSLNDSIQQAKQDIKSEDSFHPRKSRRERFSTQKMIDMIPFTFNRKRKYDEEGTCAPKKCSKKVVCGRWTESEQTSFLRGIKKFGRGKWSKIASMIPSRTVVQVKTHGQTMFKNIKSSADLELMLMHVDDTDTNYNSSSSTDQTIPQSDSESEFNDCEIESLVSHRSIPSARRLTWPVVPTRSLLSNQEPQGSHQSRQCNLSARSLFLELTNDDIAGAQTLVIMKNTRGD